MAVKCDLCGKLCGNRNGLTLHMKTHKDEGKAHNDSTLLQDSLLFDEGDLSTTEYVSDTPIGEASGKALKVKGGSKVGKVVSKKLKEGKG